jgi:hypothetical protein
LLAIVAIAAGVVLADAHVIQLGLFSDDFQWLTGAQRFEPASLLLPGFPHHFMRPMANVFFLSAFGVCGHASGCLHGATLVLHGSTGVVVTLAVFSLSRKVVVSIMAGVLFVVQPAPTEARTWLSAACEVFSAFFFVLTFWLFRLALEARTARRGVLFFGALLSCVACMLSHEAGVLVVPILFLAAWWFSNDVRVSWAAPFVLVFLVDVVMLWGSMTNPDNITGGNYGVGFHMARHIFGALVSLAVASRHFPGLIAVSLFYLWAIVFAPRRIRFWAMWTIIALVPFAGFRNSLPTRYFYLASVGFAAMTAETIWWVREVAPRRRAVDVLVGVVAVVVVARCVLFERRNVHIWDSSDAAYSTYAATVRRLYPTIPPGSTVVVPRPPAEEMGEQYVQPLVQWEYRDLTLKTQFSSER